MKSRMPAHVLPLKSIMKTDVVRVRPTTPVLEAMQLLADKQISGLPVVDEADRVVGILTEKDVLKILRLPNLDYADTVEKYMTRDVVTFEDDDSALAVAEFFERSAIRRVPVVKEGRLVGIVARRDIIRLILEAKSQLASLRFC